MWALVITLHIIEFLSYDNVETYFVTSIYSDGPCGNAYTYILFLYAFGVHTPPHAQTNVETRPRVPDDDPVVPSSSTRSKSFPTESHTHTAHTRTRPVNIFRPTKHRPYYYCQTVINIILYTCGRVPRLISVSSADERSGRGTRAPATTDRCVNLCPVRPFSGDPVIFLHFSLHSVWAAKKQCSGGTVNVVTE